MADKEKVAALEHAFAAKREEIYTACAKEMTALGEKQKAERVQLRKFYDEIVAKERAAKDEAVKNLDKETVNG